MKKDILLVQMGYSGRPFAQQAIEKKYAEGVILSPSDFDKEKNKEIAISIQNLGGIVLFDNHWYDPRSKRVKLYDYTYFNEYGGNGYTTETITDDKVKNEFCSCVLTHQDELKVDAYISPGGYIDSWSEKKIKQYCDLVKTFIKCKIKEGRDIPCFAGLSISNKVIVDPDNRKKLLDYITGLKCDGFYLSFEVLDGEGYPLTRSADVLSLTNFVYKIKKNGYYVIMGHSHHISYLLLCAGIDGFATGHYKNLRSFDIKRWDIERRGGRNPALNYFSNPLLNDLRVESDLEFLYQSEFDINQIRSNSPYEEKLFKESPSYSNWTLRESWDHYLWCCNDLLNSLKGKNTLERISNVENKIKSAKKLYDECLNEIGILSEPDEKLYTSWIGALNILKKMESRQ